jgi:hypothetical protein
MQMSFSDLLELVPRAADRQELEGLGRTYHALPGSAEEPERSSPGGGQRQESLDRLMERVQWHFRAIRRPMPSRTDLDLMIRDHFEGGH